MLQKLVRVLRTEGLAGPPSSASVVRARLTQWRDRSGRTKSARYLGERFFNSQRAYIQSIPTIGGHDTMVLLHNDAVVQGLSGCPFMQTVKHWVN